MDSLIYLAKLCPSLPIIWKLLWLVGWPVWLLWWMNSWGGLQMFFVSFTKGPGGFPYVFLITTLVTTLVPVDGTTLVDHSIFVPGRDQEAFDGPATFEVGLNAIPATDLFDTFTKTLCVGYDNVTLIFNFIGDRLSSCSALVAYPIIDLTGRPVESFLHLVQSPFRILIFSESLPEMVLFLLEQLRLAAHCGGPMGEGVDYTKYGWEVMVTIPL